MSKYFWIFAVVALTAAGLAVQSNAKFADKANNMTLDNFSSWSSSFTKEGMKFNVAGNPLRAAWKQQGMQITAKKLSGFAAKGLAGRYSLSEGTTSGDVHAVFTRASGAPTTGATQTVAVDSETMRFNAGATASRVDIPGALTLLNQDPGLGRSMKMTGSSGIITLPAAGGTKSILTADLDGPVRIDLKDSEVESGVRREYTVVGTANKMVLDNRGAQPVVTMSGNVKIDGNHPVLFAEISNVQQAVLTLNASFEPVSIDISGTPASTRLRQIPEPKRKPA